MPELPEMEHYRRLLTPCVAGRIITDVDITREKSINVPVPTFRDALVGSAIGRVDRRAKHLLFRIDAERVLLLHLMLGGVLFWGRPEQKPDRSVQVEIAFGQERLHFIGLRLGYLHLLTAADAEVALRKLGPEPLDESFGGNDFAALLRKRRGALKATLVDQSFVSGIGNCYSDEICFVAGVLPYRSCESLQPDEIDRLYGAVRSVLTEATAHGGYMDMPLYVGDAVTGGFDSRCRIYDRAGEACVRCGHVVEQRDVGSRKSFCCTNCQR